MADRGIIFSAPMVRELLAGGKSQTRRLLADASVHEDIASEEAEDFELRGWIGFSRADALCAARVSWHPGDRLWVKEACAVLAEPQADFPGNVAYRADHEEAPIRWRSPIHMPRWASRLTLTVTDVRVQRLQEISEADAVAEGLYQVLDGSEANGCWTYDGASDFVGCWDARGAYRKLWNSLHGPAAWDANPWVAVITFAVEKQNIDAQAIKISEEVN